MPPPESAKRVQPRILSFVGPTATMHLSSPAGGATSLQEDQGEQLGSTWVALSVTPLVRTANEYRGTELLLSQISFQTVVDDTPSQDKGGITVQMKGFVVPGVYTIEYRQKDPKHPASCPSVSISQLVQVHRAQVITESVVVCSHEAFVRAVPLPRELQKDFYGQWEVLSRDNEASTAAGVPLTSGADLAGMRFVHSAKPETRIIGLPFGVVTIRWAVYKNIMDTAASGAADVVIRRELVDEAHVTIFVLTENLRSNRIVTLGDSIDVPITSSTHQWRFEDTGGQHAASPSVTGVLSRPSYISFRFTNESVAGTVPSAVMTAHRLRVGVTRLLYDIRPSLRAPLMEQLKNLSCPIAPQTSLLEIERVSAYLSLQNVSGEHECDAYAPNRVNFSLCLEAGDRTSAQFFNERVALIDAGQMERVVKEDAARFASTVGCSMPWWTSADAAEWTTAFGYEDQRCLFIAVRAKRHLTPREAAHPLFEAAALPTWGAAAAASTFQFTPCHAGLDVFTSRLVEGVDAVSISGGMKPFLPILDPSSLRTPPRLHAGLRPLVGFDAREDDVALEGQLATESPTGAIVTLQLDHAHATLPFTHHATGAAPTLLDRCLDGTLALKDVAASWAVTESVAGRVRERWNDYVAQAGDKIVHCEPLWSSLEHMLPRPHDTPDSLAARRNQPVPANRQSFVRSEEIEEQLGALNRSHYWTRDGIEVTGLTQELRNALFRKKLTAKQYEEIQRHRAATAHERQHQMAHPQLSADEQEPTTTPSSSMMKDGPGPNDDGRNSVVPALPRRLRFEGLLEEYEVWYRQGHTQRATTPSAKQQMFGGDKHTATYRDSPVAAIRVELPGAPRFTAPETFAVRMSLFKNCICGAHIPAAPIEQAAASTVVFQRLVIRDQPAVVHVSPLRVKQCDIESLIPPISIQLEHTIFGDSVVNDTFADWRRRIELVEVENTNVTALLAAEGGRHLYSDHSVGLTPCLGSMLRGARVVLDAQTSQKLLQLQFAPCPQFLMLSNEEYNERQDGGILLARLQHPRYLRVVINNVVEGDSFTTPSAGSSLESITFTVTVAPTLVRLFLRGSGGNPPTGGDLFHAALPPSTQGGGGPTPSLPLLCENQMKRDGFELGFELVGDNWHYAVGRSFVHADDRMFSHDDSDRAEAQLVLQGQRTQQDVSLLNAFSLVEHHMLDAATYAFLYIGGGMYRSHFIHYLFSSVLRDAVGGGGPTHHSSPHGTQNAVSPLNDARQTFVHRYNDTFIGLRLPSASSNSDGKPRAARDHHHRLPASLAFNTVEEILFAVPGIATRCNGCLLADRTFYVAGDGSGVLSAGSSAAASGRVPASSRRLSDPLEVAFDGLSSIPRTIEYAWLCSASAASFAQGMARKYSEDHRHASSAFYVLDLFILAPRDALGRALPLASQPRRLLASLPVVASGEQSRHPVTVFTFSDDALTAAFEQISADYTSRYKKLHATSMYDFVPRPGGSVALNATATLSFCLSPADCTVFFYKPTQLVVDRRGEKSGGSSTSALLWRPEVFLHHALTVMVFWYSRRVGGQGKQPASMFALGLLSAILLVASATASAVWITVWLAVWTDLFRSNRSGLWPVVIFGLHGLLYAMCANRRE